MKLKTAFAHVPKPDSPPPGTCRHMPDALSPPANAHTHNDPLGTRLQIETEPGKLPFPPNHLHLYHRKVMTPHVKNAPASENYRGDCSCPNTNRGDEWQVSLDPPPKLQNAFAHSSFLLSLNRVQGDGGAVGSATVPHTSPEYGPESPGEAFDRLFELYQRVGDGPSGEGFVTTLICEILMLKVMQRSMKKRRS